MRFPLPRQRLFPFILIISLPPSPVCKRKGSTKKTKTGRRKTKTTYPCLLRGLVLLAQIPQPVVLFLLQVGVFLDLGLVEPVDDGVLPLADQYFLDLMTAERGFSELAFLSLSLSLLCVILFWYQRTFLSS